MIPRITLPYLTKALCKGTIRYLNTTLQSNTTLYRSITITILRFTQAEQNVIVRSLSRRASTELPLTRPFATKTTHYMTRPYLNCTDLRHNIVSRDSTIPIQPRTIYGYTSPVHPRTIHRSTLLNQHDTLHHRSIQYVTIPHPHRTQLTYTSPVRTGTVLSNTLPTQTPARHCSTITTHYLTNTVATHST